MDRSRKRPNKKDAALHTDEQCGSVPEGSPQFAEGHEICIDFANECPNCGAIVEFLSERCPICGKKFEMAETGLGSMFSGMDFETDISVELSCPLCGETIRPKRGRCPECKERIAFTSPDDPGTKVDPIVHDDNIVFVHLDVESGEVNCVQRVESSSGFEHVSVHLESIGQGDFDRARKGVVRM